MRINVLIIIIFSTLVSCTKFKLSKNDLEWQPYKIGDLLVFESNKNEIDSIKIVAIDSYINPKDPLSPFSSEHETLFVEGELLNPVSEYRHLSHMNFLRVHSDEKTYLFFNLKKLSDSLDYAQVNLSIEQLNDLYKRKTKQYNCFNDIIELTPNYTGGLEYEYDLKNYLWSRKYGYVRYDFKNNYFRELKKFIRNGKNIFPECD